MRGQMSPLPNSLPPGERGKKPLLLERKIIMSATITLEEAQIHLAELIAKLAPGEEIVIMDKQQPVA